MVGFVSVEVMRPRSRAERRRARAPRRPGVADRGTARATFADAARRSIQDAMGDTHNRLGEFLRARRALVTPDDVGLPDLGRRRVTGLRRRGARAARRRQRRLLRPARAGPRHPSVRAGPRRARPRAVPRPRRGRASARPGASGAPPAPAARAARTRPAGRAAAARELVRDPRVRPRAAHGRPRLQRARGDAPRRVQDRAQHGAPGLPRPRRPRHVPEFDGVAQETVATLRAAAGADLDDPRLAELVGELSLKSDEFRRLWARHEVREKASGLKRMLHPMVGELVLGYETLRVNDAPEQLVVGYHAAPGSASARALALLARWPPRTASPPSRRPPVARAATSAAGRYVDEAMSRPPVAAALCASRSSTPDAASACARPARPRGRVVALAWGARAGGMPAPTRSSTRRSPRAGRPAGSRSTATWTVRVTAAATARRASKLPVLAERARRQRGGGRGELPGRRRDLPDRDPRPADGDYAIRFESVNHRASVFLDGRLVGAPHRRLPALRGPRAPARRPPRARRARRLALAGGDEGGRVASRLVQLRRHRPRGHDPPARRERGRRAGRRHAPAARRVGARRRHRARAQPRRRADAPASTGRLGPRALRFAPVALGAGRTRRCARSCASRARTCGRPATRRCRRSSSRSPATRRRLAVEGRAARAALGRRAAPAQRPAARPARRLAAGGRAGPRRRAHAGGHGRGRRAPPGDRRERDPQPAPAQPRAARAPRRRGHPRLAGHRPGRLAGRVDARRRTRCAARACAACG